MSTDAPARKPQRGDELDLRVDALAFGGKGVARLEGYVVFVAGAVPGDRVRATVTKRKRAYAEAQATEVLEPSPDRIAPRADHPGAPWQVLPYERQLEIKHQQVEEALRRLGHLDAVAVEPIVGAAAEWRYRNKAEFSFGTGPEGRLECGFHPPGRWYEVAPMEECLLVSERADAARRQVLDWARACGLTAHDRRSHEGLLRNLVIREGRRTGQLQVRLVVGDGELDEAAFAQAVDAEGIFVTRTDALAETTLGGRTTLVAGAAELDEELGGLRYRISPEAFFQTNTEMAEVLYGTAAEFAGLAGFERVYDLFCGIGTIGLSLAPRAGQVFGLELVEAAVADAIRNAEEHEIANSRFSAGDVRLALRNRAEQPGRPAVVVVDPPRAGMSAKVVRRIIEAAPRRIVYVSCNATPLAPNSAQLVEAGYALRRVRPVDMFPQTPHIECVALLERAG